MGKKVLVVDDERLIVKGIKFSLVQDDMEVDCAYDGEEALEMAKKTEYDIVLLDVMLPKMDGFEVCRQIRDKVRVPIGSFPICQSSCSRQRVMTWIRFSD